MLYSYPEETKAEIERVLEVFKDYIRTTLEFDILWSDKAGYIYVDMYKVEQGVEAGDVRTEWIGNAQKLVKILLCDIAGEALEHEIPIEAATEQDCERIFKLYQPYMAQLPEYAHIVPIVFKRGWRCV